MTAPEVTIWERDDRACVYRAPTNRWPKASVVHFTIAERMRWNKHLTEAECLAEMWRAVYEDEVFEYADPEHKYSKTLERFATHDQAV